MNKAKLKLVLLAIFIPSLIFLSCKKDKMEEGNTNNTSNYDCEFFQNDSDMDGLIDDNERAIMEDCYDNRYFSKSEIEENIIGEWELIGHGEGWDPSMSQPCGYLTVTEEEIVLQYEDSNSDTTTIHTWEIVSAPSGIFTLIADPLPALSPLKIYVFCEEYMYGDATPGDGNMYLFQKVK